MILLWFGVLCQTFDFKWNRRTVHLAKANPLVAQVTGQETPCVWEESLSWDHHHKITLLHCLRSSYPLLYLQDWLFWHGCFFPEEAFISWKAELIYKENLSKQNSTSLCSLLLSSDTDVFIVPVVWSTLDTGWLNARISMGKNVEFWATG